MSIFLDREVRTCALHTNLTGAAALWHQWLSWGTRQKEDRENLEPQGCIPLDQKGKRHGGGRGRRRATGAMKGSRKEHGLWKQRPPDRQKRR